jgi:hypothetical protein
MSVILRREPANLEAYTARLVAASFETRAKKAVGAGSSCAPASPKLAVIPRERGIQYAAAFRFNHERWWNTGSPAFAGDDE